MSATSATGEHAVPLLRLTKVSKSFQGIPAVTAVDLTLRSGEVLALIGENGAGKSTLVKIISGVHPSDSYEGELAIDGLAQAFRSVRQAEEAGVVLVPQELHIAPGLSIAENMFMGMLPVRRGFVDEGQLWRMARERLAFFGIEARPDAPAGVLSPSSQRLVTIASALSRKARILILDEPTAALTDSEAEHLFDRMKQVQGEGVGVLYITHRLDELDQVADRVVVMRNSAVVAEADTAKGNRRELVRAMIGRDPQPGAPRKPASRDRPVLTVTDLTVRDPHGANRRRVDRASLVVHRSEIVGLFGLVGAGRTELAQALFGAWPGAVDGTVEIDGQSGRPASPREAIARGLAMLTEDRKQTGLIDGQSISVNISAASLEDVSGHLFIDDRKERERNQGLVSRLDVRPPRLRAPINALSGGNQQKALLARWLATRPKLLIIDEPTFGVDIGARMEMYRLIRELADTGCGVLMISSDLNEVREESDRILVMYKGRITGEFEHGADRLTLMAAATGEPN